MLAPIEAHKGRVSMGNTKREGEGPMQVLCSGAGYYLGTLWHHYNEDGTIDWSEPNSRASCYYPTREMAAMVLADLEGEDEDE